MFLFYFILNLVVGVLKVNDEKKQDPDPDPHQNVMDPDHCIIGCVFPLTGSAVTTVELTYNWKIFSKKKKNINCKNCDKFLPGRRRVRQPDAWCSA
jgi:hypothetical protein